MRTFLGVVAGYLTFALGAVALFQFTGAEPHGQATVTFIVLSTLYGMVFAFLAGYVATRIARRQDRRAGAAVMMLIAAGAVGVLIALPKGDSPWSAVATLVFMSPMALAAATLAKSSRREKAFR